MIWNVSYSSIESRAPQGSPKGEGKYSPCPGAGFSELVEGGGEKEKSSFRGAKQSGRGGRVRKSKPLFQKQIS